MFRDFLDAVLLRDTCSPFTVQPVDLYNLDRYPGVGRVSRYTFWYKRHIGYDWLSGGMAESRFKQDYASILPIKKIRGIKKYKNVRFC